MEIRRSSQTANERIHRMLQEYNKKYMQDGGDFCFSIEEDGTPAAGIVAGAVFDTVEVEYLCVAKDCRGRGYGEALLKRVEEEARAQNKRRILLNTYSFQAPEFYRKMGYQQLFVINPVFQDCVQYFFIKEL